MPNRHGPDADSRSGSARNARLGCTSAIRFSTRPSLTGRVSSINPIKSTIDGLRDFSPVIAGQYDMLTHIRTETDLDLALAALGQADPRFLALMATAGRPPLRRRPDGFAGLAATVVAQQLSTASANAIWARLAAAFDPLAPAAIMRARPARLARLGLSAPKIRALKEIARAIARGELALAALGELAAEDAHAALTAVHGDRAVDGRQLSVVLPRACRCLAGGRSRFAGSGTACLRVAGAAEAPSRWRLLAEPWRPWRSVAARVLWSYYRAVKGREGAPVQPTKTPSKRGNGR